MSSNRTNITNYARKRRKTLRSLAQQYNWKCCIVCRTMFDMQKGKGGAAQAVCANCLQLDGYTHAIPCDVRNGQKRKVRGTALTIHQSLFPLLFKNPARFLQQRYVYLPRQTVIALRKLVSEVTSNATD